MPRRSGLTPDLITDCKDIYQAVSRVLPPRRVNTFLFHYNAQDQYWRLIARWVHDSNDKTRVYSLPAREYLATEGRSRNLDDIRATRSCRCLYYSTSSSRTMRAAIDYLEGRGGRVTFGCPVGTNDECVAYLCFDKNELEEVGYASPLDANGAFDPWVDTFCRKIYNALHGDPTLNRNLDRHVRNAFTVQRPGAELSLPLWSDRSATMGPLHFDLIAAALARPSRPTRNSGIVAVLPLHRQGNRFGVGQPHVRGSTIARVMCRAEQRILYDAAPARPLRSGGGPVRRELLGALAPMGSMLESRWVDIRPGADTAPVGRLELRRQRDHCPKPWGLEEVEEGLYPWGKILAALTNAPRENEVSTAVAGDLIYEITRHMLYGLTCPSARLAAATQHLESFYEGVSRMEEEKGLVPATFFRDAKPDPDEQELMMYASRNRLRKWVDDLQRELPALRTIIWKNEVDLVQYHHFSERPRMLGEWKARGVINDVTVRHGDTKAWQAVDAEALPTTPFTMLGRHLYALSRALLETKRAMARRKRDATDQTDHVPTERIDRPLAIRRTGFPKDKQVPYISLPATDSKPAVVHYLGGTAPSPQAIAERSRFKEGLHSMFLARHRDGRPSLVFSTFDPSKGDGDGRCCQASAEGGPRGRGRASVHPLLGAHQAARPRSERAVPHGRRSAPRFGPARGARRIQALLALPACRACAHGTGHLPPRREDPVARRGSGRLGPHLGMGWR